MSASHQRRATIAGCLLWMPLPCQLAAARGPVFGFVVLLDLDYVALIFCRTQTTGPNWPTAGEIDIIEGVNNQATNQMTLHSGTSNACTLSKEPSTNNVFSGNAVSTNCYSSATADGGCGISDPNPTSFGYGFNGAGGGVFALLWDTTTGMSIWHFPRAKIPKDITNKAPTPANWGIPAGFWSSQTCDIASNFYQHSLIIDTTVCGNWAGSAYGQSGCPGTCSEMVANATNFASELIIVCSILLILTLFQMPSG